VGSFTLRLRGNHRASLCATDWSASVVLARQARFRLEQVSFAGKTTAWKRTAESGNTMTYHFCPTCGSTVYWENDGFPGYVTVAIGNFADPKLPAPTIAVWEETRHPWVFLPPDAPSAWRSRGDRLQATS